jgi:hypothetical protein
MECLRAAASRKLAWIDLRPEVERAYNAELAKRLDGSVWARTGKSWYKRADGRITNNWSGTTLEYWWRTRRVDLSLYRSAPRAKAQAPVVAKVA